MDKTLGDKLRIALNVSFPALTCAEVHLDAMDVLRGRAVYSIYIYLYILNTTTEHRSRATTTRTWSIT